VKKLLIMLMISLLLIGCQNTKKIRIEAIEDYFDLLQEDNDNIVKIRSDSVPGHFFFSIYFDDDYPLEDVEDTLDLVKDFLDKEDVQEAMYTYYFDHYEEPAVVNQKPPSLWIKYYTQSSNNRVFYYEKWPVFDEDDIDSQKTWHDKWEKYE